MKCPRCGGKLSYVELKPKVIKRRAKLKCNSCEFEEVFA